MTDKWGAGDQATWRDLDQQVDVGGRKHKLVFGQHPHSRRDNDLYAIMHGEAVAFDGHRIQVGVEISEHNYLKESGLSGDEVRKGGSAKILADGVVVFEFFHRDTLYALLKAHQLIGELREHASGWLMRSERDRLVGRKVFYREHPAVVERLIVDQGCLILRTAEGEPFPPPVWRDARDPDDEDSTVKVEVTDPNIWWWRED